jgi:mono/diheme cytochrome c family protein
MAPIATVLIAASLLPSHFISGPSPTAMAQEKKQAPPGFDYWQPDWMIRELWGPGQMPKGMAIRLLRHTTFTQLGVPKAYEGARSTVPAGKETIAAGATLYGAQCASCHGKDGMGDGVPARSVAPSPALLAFMISRPIAVDEYLLWAISDGGKQFDSEMPAFKDKLSREDIWRIVAYMRAGFPEPTTTAK